MSKNEDLNMTDLFKKMGLFLRKRILIVLALLVLCLGGSFTLFKFQPQFFQYQMVFNSNHLSHGDLILTLKKFTEYIDRGDYQAVGLDWNDEDKSKIRGLDCQKQYGSIKENVVLQLQCSEKGLAGEIEEGILSYLNKAERVVELDAEIAAKYSDELEDLKATAYNLEKVLNSDEVPSEEVLHMNSTKLQIEQLIVELEFLLETDRSYYLVSGFDLDSEVVAGPILRNYLELGLLLFLVLFALNFYFFIRK